MTKLWATALTATMLFLSSCSQGSRPSGGEGTTVKAEEPSTSHELVTAKAAYLAMYKSAYKWASDLVMLRLTPKEVPGFTNASGKAAMWEAVFASPGKHECRVFSYAIAAHSPDIYEGVSVGRAIPWNGVTRDVMPIPTSGFIFDSDAAYTVAAADAAAWLKKNPEKKLSSFHLGNGYSFPAPVWYLMWGDKKSGYVVFVNATTGKVLKK